MYLNSSFPNLGSLRAASARMNCLPRTPDHSRIKLGTARIRRLPDTRKRHSGYVHDTVDDPGIGFNWPKGSSEMENRNTSGASMTLYVALQSAVFRYAQVSMELL